MVSADGPGQGVQQKSKLFHNLYVGHALYRTLCLSILLPGPSVIHNHQASVFYTRGD